MATTTSTDAKISEAISARVSKRCESAKIKSREAELAKNRGNEFYKAGKYMSASKEYATAAFLYPEPNYCSNWAAAMLKLEMYEEAAEAAQLGLLKDPRHIKCRFRRLCARKSMGLYRAALCDAEAMLCIDPNCKEAKMEVKELKRLARRNPKHEDDSDSEADWPRPEIPVPLMTGPEDWTDSEDSEHTGNDIPCKYYNHDGCARGSECAFSHALDVLSERDRLGKNVCIFFLLDRCKFGESKCNYSHSKAALSSTGWWNVPEAKSVVAENMKMMGLSGALKARLVKHPKLGLPKAMRGTPVSGKANGKKSRVGRKPSKKPRRDETDEDELEERTRNYGFTEAEVEELLCQGVKPWDDDAWDVMAVLNGGF